MIFERYTTPTSIDENMLESRRYAPRRYVRQAVAALREGESRDIDNILLRVADFAMPPDIDAMPPVLRCPPL